MRFGSVCSGIEAASTAWHPLGWKAAFFSEIEAFPSALLAHRYPHVPNHGDMTRFHEWPDHAIDLLVGGTPCQSFSVAGLRKGLADPRGNLALTYLAIADRYRPEWLVWENVPGVLSSDGGRDFGAFLGGLGELGYGFAYRVLDAQFCRVDGFGRAVPQRRRRVFVVGHSGDWRRAAAVLFERESLSWHSAPRRQAGQGVAPTISSRPTGGGGLGADFDCDGGLIASTGEVSHCLNAGGMGRIDYESETMIACAHSLRADGFDASEDGTGRGTPLVPIAFAHQQGGNIDLHMADNVGLALQRCQTQAVAFGVDGACGTLPANPGSGTRSDGSFVEAAIVDKWAVRRLTPTECERLQGFPDGYTAIPYRNKPAADGPRYKALGNSMACNVMRWIGRRIEAVALLDARRNAA
jgi:DNA (cytosine-5)-methyltransferase 1